LFASFAARGRGEESLGSSPDPECAGEEWAWAPRQIPRRGHGRPSDPNYWG